MAKKIGIFESQQQVIGAITQLEDAGFKPGDIKILAKDSEHSRRIEAESDVHVDEMRELEETQNDAGTREETIGTAYSTGMGNSSVAMTYGFTAFGGGPTAGTGFLLPVSYAFIGGNEHERVFRALGLDSKESELCCREVERGGYALIVETTESKSLLDKDGGPDLSTLGVAEAVFRSCNASLIADGS